MNKKITKLQIQQEACKYISSILPKDADKYFNVGEYMNEYNAFIAGCNFIIENCWVDKNLVNDKLQPLKPNLPINDFKGIFNTDNQIKIKKELKDIMNNKYSKNTNGGFEKI